jgi:periplasmic protein TonB
MSDYNDEFESESDPPLRPGQLSPTGHWLFGSLVAALVLIGFAFGVVAGTSRPKPVEVVKETTPEKPTPPVVQPQPQPSPKPKEPEPKVITPEPKQPMEPEPKAKEPEPKPKVKEPEPKQPEPKPKEPEPKVNPVAFKDVRPILMTYCGNCHGNAGKPKAGVDLRTVAAIMKGGDDGDVIKAGDPKKSRLYLSITEGAMPPDGKPAPNPKELQLIHDWIASGAKERRRPGRGVRGARIPTRRRVPLTSRLKSE